MCLMKIILILDAETPAIHSKTFTWLALSFLISKAKESIFQPFFNELHEANLIQKEKGFWGVDIQNTFLSKEEQNLDI